ncbi:MAG TPA: hypothetical protein VLK33_22840, partial [Terriglobales bacterium]|nr:hypothetical protein [Terriglobales bacterium]
MLKSWFCVRARVWTTTLICVGIVVLFPSQQTTAASGINRQLNYQAKLLTSTAVPVTDGAYSIKFSLYDAPSGGNILWTAGGTTSSPSAVSVTVTSGLLTVQLGDTAAGQNLLNIDWNQDSLYLGVTIAADSEMTPRKRLTAVPYAFMAESLQGQYASSSVSAAGGTLFKLQQSSSDAASSPRTSLFISTSGTSNLNDFLIKAAGASEVFSVSRQGHTTTTGNLEADGNVIFGDTAADTAVFNAQINSALISAANNTFDLGSGSNAWRNIYA